MRYPRFIHSSLFILFIIYHPLATHAKVADMKITKEEGSVDIEADQLFYERDAQLYHAHGGVEVARGNLFLKSDHARLNMATKELEAWGNVLLREGEDVIECERLEVNLDTRLGKVYKAKLFLKDQNFHITGQEAEKLGENRYRIRDGSFTTCDAARPPWKFTVKELEVTLDGHGIAKGPVFYLEDIPVFYFPFGIFPVRRERQTGFLIPRVGYSKEYGPEVKTAFFWAIAKDMDSTLYLDSLGRRGFKEGLEYRYALTQDTKGQANFYFIDDKVSERDRYSFFYQHQQKFPNDFYLKWDVNHVSDHDYTRDFDEDLPSGAKIDSRSRGYLRSDLFGGKNWDQFSFLAEAEVFNNLTQESNDETVQHLPQMSFHAHPQPFFKTPFFYDVASSYTHFWRERGVQTHRGDLFPRISYPTRLFNILKVESNMEMRETLYWSDGDPTGKFKGGKSREIIEGGAEASVEFYRVYGSNIAPGVSKTYNVAKWMHTIEPTLGYRYRPRVKQKDIPAFDDLDFLSYTNQITYGFTQRLVGKPEKEGTDSGPYEYAKLNISHSYSLGDPFEVDSKGHERYFSNIQTELWWNFSPHITANWNAEFNPYGGNFDIWNGSLYFKDSKNNIFQVGYRYTKDIIQGIDFDTWIKMIKPFYLYGAIRYNLLEKMRIENIYGIEYQSQCWALGFTIDDINRSPDGTQKRDLKFHVYFNLMGMGSVGRKPYYMIF
jgi:LPS-assembly protein